MNPKYKAQLWAREIKRLSFHYCGENVDVYNPTRRRSVIQYRSLHIYMCRKILNFSLYQIRDLYKANGMTKTFHHASVLHSLNMFELYKEYDPSIMEMYYIMLRGHRAEENTLNDIITKINFINPNYYSEMINGINYAFDLTVSDIKRKCNDIQSKNKPVKIK